MKIEQSLCSDIGLCVIWFAIASNFFWISFLIYMVMA